MLQSSRAALKCPLAIASIFLALYALLALRGTSGNAGYVDAYNSHLPLANWFIENGFTLFYPRLSTTAPGFHWLLAALARIAGEQHLSHGDTIALAVPAILGLGLLLILFCLFRLLGASHMRACLLLIPVAASRYFWWQVMYPLTEGLAFVGYATMAIAVVGAETRVLLFGLGAAIATIARQIFWPVSLAAIPLIAYRFWYERQSPRSCLLALLAAIGPAAAIFGTLVLAWGGPLPPGWDIHRTSALINASPIAHGIMLTGLLGVPFLRPEDFTRRAWPRDACVSLVLAVACWAALPLDGNVEQGRWGSAIWQISDASPKLLGRPMVLLVLLMLGCQMLLIAWRRAQSMGQHTAPELLLFVFYLLAWGGQAYSWQRYAEMPVLIFLTSSLARTRSSAMDFGTATVFVGYFIVAFWRF